MPTPAANNQAVAFPLALDSGGEAARVQSLVIATEQLIEELLFTALGERLNHPDLGCGLLELVFQSNSDELRAATQFQVSAGLQRWLGNLIRVISVVTQADGAGLITTVNYALLADGVARAAVYTQ
jgi:phage baseplate assembly protein W